MLDLILGDIFLEWPSTTDSKAADYYNLDDLHKYGQVDDMHCSELRTKPAENRED